MPLIKVDVHIHVHTHELPGDIATELQNIKKVMGENFDKLKADVDALNGKLDAAATSIGEVKKDVDFLKTQLGDLSGGATAAQIAELQATVDSLSTKADSVAGALSALDSETDSGTPVPPPTA